jgi:hypothetical protein
MVVLATIEDPAVIRRILTHLGLGGCDKACPEGGPSGEAGHD